MLKDIISEMAKDERMACRTRRAGSDMYWYHKGRAEALEDLMDRINKERRAGTSKRKPVKEVKHASEVQ